MYASSIARASLWIALVVAGLTACETTPLYQMPSSTTGPSTAPRTTGAAGMTAMAPTKDLAPDGGNCASDGDCKSEHCSSGVCCEDGDCCQSEKDCPGAESLAAVCDDKKNCQGSRGSIMCSKFRCRTRDGVKDDSACDAKVKSRDCGAFQAVFCSGKVEQEAPKCATSCVDDSACDSTAHCEGGTCIDDQPDGGECEVDAQCNSGHCLSGVCCKSGDCCRRDTDCSATVYGDMGTCMDRAMCQGTRGAPACEEFQCVKRQIEDDTACDRNVIANDCGTGPDVRCRGGADQMPPPPCATGTCSGFARPSCNPEAFCWQNACVPDQPNGEGCTDNNSCQSGHCGTSRVCCDEGDCCENDSQCPTQRVCDDLEHCQGTRKERYCDRNSGACAVRMMVDDDSGCGGMTSTKTCELNSSPTCTMAVEQTDDPVCPVCRNLPRCAASHVDQRPVTIPGGPDGGMPTMTTVPVTVCDQWVNDIPVFCDLGARCSAGTGRCY